MALAERLKAVIASAGCTVDAFGNELGEPSHRIKDILRGKQKAPQDFLAKVHLMYGVDLNWLVVGDAAGKPKKGQQLAVLLPPRQRSLLAHFDAASESGKKLIEGTAAMAAQGKAGALVGSVAQSADGDHVVQIGTVGGNVSGRVGNRR